MNIFQIPKTSEETCDRIVGIIDASGSMGGQWVWVAEHWNTYITNNPALSTTKKLTITFDHTPRIAPDNILNKSIKNHGGGTTNISKAMDMFEKEMEKIPKEECLTVIFISDGHDNAGGDLKTRLSKLQGNKDKRRINFLCLGAGSGFPTFISMQLRETYHNGDETVPAVFLIEYVTEKAYTIKFQSIMEFMTFSVEKKVNPPVTVFPWREPMNSVFEHAWVMTHENKVIIDGDEMDVTEFNLNLNGIQELFRSWAQSMHLESLVEGEDIKTRALKTLGLMDDIIEGVKEKEKLDLLNLEEIKEDMTFLEKANLNFIKNHYNRAKWFYDDVKAIADGQTDRKSVV